MPDVCVQDDQTTMTIENGESDNRRHVISTDTGNKDEVTKKFETIEVNLNGEGTLGQKLVNVQLDDHSDDILVNSVETNNEVAEDVRNRSVMTTGNIVENNRADRSPLAGYADEPILPLSKACVPLNSILHNVSFYVQMALEETPEKPPDGLTIDESAAIRLYTIEWEEPHRSLYSMLNYTLTEADRQNVRPYLKYLKLFLTALVKLPCQPPLTVWRGVTQDLSAKFPPGVPVTWWSFASTTTELPVLENNMYLGNNGSRTLFSVETINGRTIQAHSHFVTENEILLLPGTYMIVQSQFSPAIDLHIIHLKQEVPKEILVQPPFEGILNSFDRFFETHNISTLRCTSISQNSVSLTSPYLNVKFFMEASFSFRRHWYRKKRFVIPICFLIILSLGGVIFGSFFGTRARINSLGMIFDVCFSSKASERRLR